MRTRTEEALGLGHPLERKKAKERSRSFGFGQAGAGQSCCWGEANKTTKERGAEQAEMLLLCVASHAAPGIRSVSSSAAAGQWNCHCGLWKKAGIGMPRRLETRDCFLAAAQRNPIRPCPFVWMDGVAIILVGSSPPKGQSRL